MEERTGRSPDHPAEVLAKEEAISLRFPGKSLKGFYDPRQPHGTPKLIFGDAEKFERDMVAFQARQKRRMEQEWRWWIIKDLEDISYGN